MKNVIFIAPPAAGKGTQSAILESFGYLHISTGDMLREEIAKESTIGMQIKDIISKGLLVSDDIVFELIKNKLTNIDKPFILDGFPRSINQALMLDQLFNELNINNYEVIYLDIDMDSAMKRALGRLTCKCGASYNIFYDNLKPKVDGICDKCGSSLTKRDDDNEESFKIRFNTFKTNNEQILEFYKNNNKLHIVDATKDNVTDTIKEILV